MVKARNNGELSSQGRSTRGRCRGRGGIGGKGSGSGGSVAGV